MTIHALESPPSPNLTRSLVRITADQYHRMIETGIIREDATTELLDGFIVHKDRSELGEDKLSHSPIHVLVVSLLTSLSARINSPACHLNIQLPISLDGRNEPEPDGSIVRGQPRDYKGHLPTASDVACIIEVAHSSLERDAEEKYAAYASAGIPQYIIINLRINQLEVHTDPHPEAAAYRTTTRASKGESIRIHLGAGESLEVPAADLLP